MFKYGWTLILLIIVAAAVFLWLIKAPIMSSYLTKKMGVPVTVRSISMWPDETNIHHFRISNPHGFYSRTALQVDKTQVRYKWKSLTNEPSEIDLITLDGVVLNIDLRKGAKDNNWSALGAHMPPRERNHEVIIHKLVLRDMTVNTEGPGAKKLGVAGTKHFDQMVFDEIDSREGFPTKELVSRIFEGAGLMQYIQNFLNPIERVKGAVNPFNLFGENEKNNDLLHKQ